jgi:hypothetical protein
MHLPAPLEVDPRPCELCGLTIDRHHLVDGGGGPEFFCFESSPLVDRLLAAKYADTNGKPFALGFNAGIEYALKKIAVHDDIAAILAGMAVTDDAPPVAPADCEPPRYRTPQATIDAFKYLVALGDAERLARWLRDHSRDAPFLQKLLEAQ